MRSFSLAATFLLCLGASASTAQTVAASIPIPCVTAPEAEALVTSILPELVLQAGQVCSATLPPDALLRQTSGAFLNRYRAEAENAWPQAQAAISKVGGPVAQAAIGSALARPLLATLVAPLITKQLQPADCPAINRIMTLAEPLPPRNTAGMIVSILQLSDAKRTDRRVPLPICKPGER